ncbi:helix-turn-helix domain-containing protein [Alcaligenaceae bacterium]|nr:helix-turn-helix domain-containing protein [Alcaligenaceae bacterium]
MTGIQAMVRQLTASYIHLLPEPPKDKRKTTNLKPEVIATVRRMRSVGASTAEIVKETGVSKTSVFRLTKSKNKESRT